MTIAKDFPLNNALVKVSQPDNSVPVYQITFMAAPDNRLNTEFCNALFSALDYVATLPPGAVVTTSVQPKFYSNGLDLQHAFETPGYWNGTLYNLFIRLLTFPMPTIAAVTGHAFAGGWMLAMCHDYRVGNETKGWYCLNELEFDGNFSHLPYGMAQLMARKLGPATFSKAALEAYRFTGSEGLVRGFVDQLGKDPKEVVRLAHVMGKEKARFGKTGTYGMMKREVWRNIVECLKEDNTKRHEILIEEVEQEKKRMESTKSKL